MTNPIDHIVKNIIRMGSNFISPQLAQNTASVGQKINKFGQKKPPYDLLKNALKT
jgi:hypothetical protein